MSLARNSIFSDFESDTNNNPENRSWLGRRYPLNREQIVREAKMGIKLGICTAMLALLILSFQKADENKNAAESVPINVLAICLLTPIFEEFLYRGIATPFAKWLLKKEFGSFGHDVALLLSCTLFGIEHPLRNQMSVFIDAMIYEKSTSLNHGSLWQSTSAHITHNVAIVTVGALVHKMKHGNQ